MKKNNQNKNISKDLDEIQKNMKSATRNLLKAVESLSFASTNLLNSKTDLNQLKRKDKSLLSQTTPLRKKSLLLSLNQKNYLIFLLLK